MASSIKKYIKRLLLLFLIPAVLVSGGMLGIMHFYGDDIIQSLLNQLNDRLATEISVDNISLNLFESFPDASLNFQGVASKDKLAAEGNSLIKAGEVSILFNIIDIFKKNYTIDKIILNDAFLNLMVYENRTNYNIFRKEDNSEGNLLVQLEKASFKNVVISYIHIPSKQEYLFRIDNGVLGGTFSSGNQKFLFAGSVYSTHIKSGENTFLKERNLSIHTEMEINEAEHTIELKGDLETDGILFDVSGFITTGKEENNLDLQVKITESPLSTLVSLIPKQYTEPVDGYNLIGDVGINAKISGNFRENTIPRVDIDFTFEEGTYSYDKSNFKLDEVFFEGSFTNGEYQSDRSYDLELRNIRSKLDDGSIKGSIQISDFSKPKINAQVLTSMNLQTLAPFLSIDTLQDLSGHMDLNLSFKNRLQDFRKFTIHDFISSTTTGSLQVKNMDLAFKNSSHNYHGFNGRFEFSNKDLLIKEFTGFISGSDFSMKGYFGNILAYAFLPDEHLFINADFSSSNFNLDEILETDRGSSSANSNLSFSSRVNYNLNLNIENFSFRKFSSTQNSGRLIQRNRILLVENAHLNSMDGKISINGSINGKDNFTYYINCSAEFEEVNIHKLFRDFGNFRQKNLTSNNLRGIVDASVQYSSTLTPGLYVNPASVYTEADLVINNGELVAYKPLYSLSKYVKKGEFEHVKFSTIKNKIEIAEEVVYIPEMDIESSSMNISLFGQHKFNNDIDYHVKLLLSDIIAQTEAIESDLGDNFVKDDGLGRTQLFLNMTGPATDPVVKYDTRQVRNKISDDLNKEREEFKSVIKEEFKWLGQKDKEPEDSIFYNEDYQKDFNIQWTDTESDSITSPKPSPKPKKKKRNKEEKEFIIKWDEEQDTIDDPPN